MVIGTKAIFSVANLVEVALPMIEPHSLVPDNTRTEQDLSRSLLGGSEERRPPDPASVEQWLRARMPDLNAPRSEDLLRVAEELLARIDELERQNHELRESQRQLEDYRDRYIDLYDSAPLGYASLDEEGYLQEINLAGAKMLGAERQAITGYPFVNHVADEDVTTFQAHLRQCIAERCETTTEVRLKSAEHLRTVQLHSVPVIDAKHGGPLCKMAIADLTERKQAEETMARLAAIVESSDDAIIAKSLDGGIFAWNDGAERLYGYTAEEVRGKSIAILIPPERAGELEEILEKLKKGERLLRYETVRVRKGGVRIDVSMTISPLRDKTGRVWGFSSIARDITDRRQAEKALRESEARHRGILETSVDAIITIDERGVIDSVNPATERLFGYPRQEMIGQKVNMLMPSPHREQHDDYLRHYTETGERKIIGIGREVVAQRKDGSTFPIDLSVSEINIDGQRLFIGLVHDVTDRKNAEMLLRRARDELEIRVRERTEELLAANSKLNYERYLFDTLMAYSPQSIYFKDAAHRYIRINQALARSFDLSDVQEAIGKTDADFFTADYATRTAAEEVEIMRSGQPIFYKEDQETYDDGRIRWVGKTKMPLYDETGTITGTFGITRDITESKQAAETLRLAKEAAEAANQAKSTFLANMSHEIRTPMNAIIGMTELVLDAPLTAQQREFLTVADEAAESLLAIINDILDFSKVEAGRLVLDYVPFDIREHLGDAMKTLAPRADRRGIELVCRVHHEVPEIVIGDNTRLRQVVLNLVGNAIKFTEAGEVALELEHQPLSEEEALLHFKIRDTGIGIPPDKQEAIFEAFEQADSTVSRRYGGTGLGLAISSRLVNLMGGRISLESEVGHGSTFHFGVQVRTNRDEPTTPRAHDPAALEGTPVLVVDDNRTNRLILEEMLSSWRLQPSAAADATDALRRLREASDNGQPFRLVVTDAHMPGMDGFALARQIKEDRTLGSTVIMMLTSGDQPGDPTRCEELGVAAYLHKPVKQSELLDAILLVLGVTEADEETVVLPEPHKRVRPLRILLAEDSLVNQKVTVTLLEREGHQVSVANNGKEALAALTTDSFDLVLMDVQMPEMDGLEAAGIIRSRERRSGGHVPIVAMTAHALKGDRERCLEAGMDEYIAKPIRSRQLLAAIASVMGETCEATSASVPIVAPESTSRIDWELVRETTRGDSAAARAVVVAALEEAPKLRAAIDEAITRGNPTALRLAAHTLKGSVQYFGAKRLRELAAGLEQLGKEGDLKDARGAFRELAAEIDQFTQALIAYLDGVNEP